VTLLDGVSAGGGGRLNMEGLDVGEGDMAEEEDMMAVIVVRF
jgi:hypothetical protein